MASNPAVEATQLPNKGAEEAPKLKLIPRIPMASPLFPAGTVSATYAEVAVGLKPVEKPCKKRSSKNPFTKCKTG